jgi:hypothetical protein
MYNFLSSLEEFSNKMTEIENQNKRYFSIEETNKLEKKKTEFANNVIFWCDADAAEDEKKARIKWEYNNMFDTLVEIINKNVDTYEDLEDEEF